MADRHKPSWNLIHDAHRERRVLHISLYTGGDVFGHVVAIDGNQFDVQAQPWGDIVTIPWHNVAVARVGFLEARGG